MDAGGPSSEPLPPSGPPPAESLALLDDPERVAAVLSPLRRRLLSCLRDEPDSASGLAPKVGLSRQRVNYHLRELERAGFLTLCEERQRRGCVERTLRPTARAYLVDPAVLDEMSADPEALRDRFSSAYLMAVAAQIMRDVAALRRGAADTGKRLATLTLQTDVRFRTPDDRRAFFEELAATVAGLAARYHDEEGEGRTFRLVMAGHPTADAAPPGAPEASGRDETAPPHRDRGARTREDGRR